MRTKLFLKNHILINSPRRSQEIEHVLRNIGKVKKEVDDVFGDHEWAIIIYNGLHTSRNVGRHSTVFAFVQGGQNLFLQCWAVHILENGRTDFFFDPSRDLLRQQMTPVNIIFPNGFVAHTVTFERDGRIMME
ncbi:uncharacterized protein LACBIDRAFT_327238 [Laccaria bicolor S238N-H82]|uniref:Predicted protein n=1 Tax=Laccaria bicolor (strain S238N-H82 / ATCC MYA-4686) TaxID=486041 RepID=B0DBK7_LACBS|nr:uncharacterized protein LACBIDRAFT_327238 [Laccaria bicolor S238N-H82]EDR08200.1 predicted protein [Laccaria bicolor S238N-H82]|eukprot:XP_001881270.1 predicted protein [Laccaria bicolor S238N-H82]